jgi:5-methylcytosine-specific restriction enzyme A
MPTRPLPACNTPTCGNRADGRKGYCIEHQPEAFLGKKPDARQTRAWRKRRAQRFALDHQTCQHCGAPATQVDHVLAIADGGAPLDLRNLQSLCDPCHARKTTLEQRARSQR